MPPCIVCQTPEATAQGLQTQLTCPKALASLTSDDIFTVTAMTDTVMNSSSDRWVSNDRQRTMHARLV
ncbi:hypothetical protein PAMP_022241 [Pampus punctatissimus]